LRGGRNRVSDFGRGFFCRNIECRVGDGRAHAIYVRQHVVVPYADDPIALLNEPRVAIAVSLRAFVRSVMTAIDLDDQAMLRTEEVHDVRSDRCLTPKA
jgi:hypothetical protein